MSYKIPNTLQSILTLSLILSFFSPRAAANACNGAGLYITNAGDDVQSFSISPNSGSDGHQTVSLAAGQSKPVTLAPHFAGSVQRGTAEGSVSPAATVVQITLDPALALGDVTLVDGYDGGATVQGSAVSQGDRPVVGFTSDEPGVTSAVAGASDNCFLVTFYTGV